MLLYIQRKAIGEIVLTQKKTDISPVITFSKKDTLVIKGIAIIMLVLYHCFSTQDRLMGYSVNMAPIEFYESMNICVGIFSFLSAYGLTKVAIKKYGDRLYTGRGASDFNLRRIISLLSAFIIPYAVCTASTLIFVGYNPYGLDADFYFNMIADMLGIAGLLGSKMMVSTWWYMSFALIIILLIPFTVALYKKFGAACIVPYIVIPLLLNGSGAYAWTGLDNMTRWLLTVPLGVIFAQGDTLERMKSFSLIKNKVVSKIVRFLILGLILTGLFVFRKNPWCQRYFYYFISSILPVVFVYFLYEFICPVPILNTILAFLGKHSSNIFFVHTFVRAVWWPDMVYSTGEWYWVFLIVFGISLGISIAITLFQMLVRWDKLIAFLTSKAAKLTTPAPEKEEA